jgi:hypothetical protein
MNKRRVAFLAVPLLTLSLLTAPNASADTPSRFDWHVSNAFIQAGTGIPQTGARAQADNGDFARISGSGMFQVRTGATGQLVGQVRGGGVFAHTDANGVLLGFGTWKATGVQDFEFFGCGGEGFPPNFCGGLLTLDVHLTGISLTAGSAEFDGVLTISCLIGPDIPAGAEEGITLNIPGVINFDDLIPEESGLTLFVAKGI